MHWPMQQVSSILPFSRPYLQYSQSPRCANAKQREKSTTDGSVVYRAFAPVLEHSNESNEEDANCDDGQNFQQHE